MSNKVSDNLNPKLILVEGSAPANPASGNQSLFIDSADHKLKRVNSSGIVTTVEGGGSSGLVLQMLQATLAANFTGTSTTQWTDLTAPTQSITLASTSSRVVCRVDGAFSASTNPETFFAIKVGATYYPLGGILANTTRFMVSGQVIVSPATSGSITVGLAYFLASAATLNCRASSFPVNEELRLSVMELAS